MEEKNDPIQEVLKEEDIDIDLEDGEPPNHKKSQGTIKMTTEEDEEEMTSTEPKNLSSPTVEDTEEQQSRSKNPREGHSHSHSSHHSHSRSPSRNSSKQSSTSSGPRSECCKACLKESRSNGRACICQVPSSRRRTPLSSEGCITCGCHGCHPEDKDLDKLEKPKSFSSSSSKSSSSSNSPRGENLKNGCCRACMKAFSENKKACLCQVPIFVRQSVLPSEGCTICKCKGCHPEEVLYKKRGGWVSSQGNSSNVGYAMYGYYPPYFPYMNPYGPSSDHYSHGTNYESRGYPRYDEWYYDKMRSPERHDRKHRRIEEIPSRKREREDSQWTPLPHDPERRNPRSHRPRSRSSSPKRSRT